LRGWGGCSRDRIHALATRGCGGEVQGPRWRASAYSPRSSCHPNGCRCLSPSGDALDLMCFAPFAFAGAQSNTPPPPSPHLAT
ncbi:uncharacterized protein SCHCODRAFT_02489760, partial [Schizophyllum commune H4-8]|uniref:uncharacterized protein n=1 Tax=Schizophyllum commune (strain H4-8 / FGSC 9210) TaxID=578458 RepID=UPI00215FEF9C